MSVDPARLELFQRLGTELGMPPAYLRPALVVPTIAGYLPRVLKAASPATHRSYGGYWQRAAEFFPTQRLDDLTATDILAFRQHVVAAARPRRTAREGRYAGIGAIRALRLLYRLAVADHLIAKDLDPAAAAPLARRLPSTRRALTEDELAEINAVVLTGGTDPALDSLLMRLHLETACRRGGALGLRLADLDTQYCRVRLREKGGTLRWQPVSPLLAATLATHALTRGARDPDDALLRYRNHRPLTGRRYDLLWARVRRRLPWAAQQNLSAHWLRHTTLTWVERQFSYAIARAYAGHTDVKGGSTLTYVKGLPREVATALQTYTGQPHPLALPHSVSDMTQLPGRGRMHRSVTTTDGRDAAVH